MSKKGRIALSTQVLEKYPGEMLKEAATVMAEADERAKKVANEVSEGDSN